MRRAFQARWLYALGADTTELETLQSEAQALYNQGNVQGAFDKLKGIHWDGAHRRTAVLILSNTGPNLTRSVDENSKKFSLKPNGSLRDISPTVLGMLGLPQPEEMTGQDLRKAKQ